MASMEQLMNGVKFYVTQYFLVKKEFADKGEPDNNAGIEQSLKEKVSETYSYSENEVNIIAASSKNILEDTNKSFIVQAILGDYITPQALEPIISENIISQLPAVLKLWHKSFTGPRGGKKTKKCYKSKAKKSKGKSKKVKKSIRRTSKKSKTYKK
jgi:hypothetical protein